MKFSDRLIKLRKSRGMTQSELAEKACVTTRSVQNYETTERQPKGEFLSRLAQALSVPESALLSDEEYAEFLAEQNEIQAVMDESLTGSKNASLNCFGVHGIQTPILTHLAFSFPFMAFSTAAIGGIAAAYTGFQKTKQTENMVKAVYKEQSRIEGLNVYFNERIESFRDEYERLAVETQKDDTSVEECKKFIQISRMLSFFQEYRALLKQKSRYCVMLISEIEEHSGKKTDFISKLMAEINNIEVKESQFAKQLKCVCESNDLSAI